MKTFRLYQGYNSHRVVTTCQAKDHGEAFNHFKKFAADKLGRDSLYGFVIREQEEADKYDK